MKPAFTLDLALRTVAIAIALVAAIDPAITSKRTTRPTIAVATSGSPRDSVIADRVSRTLAKDFTVLRAPIAGAAGTVLVGDRLPVEATELAQPVFAVLSDTAEQRVTIVAAHAPASAPPNARVPVSVTIHADGSRGKTVELTLSAGGIVIDRATHVIGADDETTPMPLTFVPTATGRAQLRVTANIVGSSNAVTTDLLVDVRDKRWAVLFFDPRPSWMSTFVRRAVERDPRFVVTSRVVTSRNVSTDAGRPPARLDDLALMSEFDAIIVGAPDALGAADVAGLESYLRRRGGSVVLLFDQRAAGPYQRLTNVDSWTVNVDSSVVPITLGARDTAALRASEMMWPARLPLGADVLADAPADSKNSVAGSAGIRRPIVWLASIGAGRLVVSGALDAWRFRDRAAFDDTWRSLIAESASSAPPALDVRISNATPAPGEQIVVDAAVRRIALEDPDAAHSMSATIDARLQAVGAANQRVSFGVWPAGDAGHLRGVVRAPDTPGFYNVAISADGNETTVPLVVARSPSHPEPDDRDLVAAWVQARGGRATSVVHVAELSSQLARAVRSESLLETWYPMHSAWWIVPFAIFLSAEWWLRRRNGLA